MHMRRFFKQIIYQLFIRHINNIIDDLLLELKDHQNF